jgi:hypothetical protein
MGVESFVEGVVTKVEDLGKDVVADVETSVSDSKTAINDFEAAYASLKDKIATAATLTSLKAEIAADGLALKTKFDALLAAV